MMRCFAVIILLCCCFDLSASQRRDLIAAQNSVVVSFSNMKMILENLDSSPLGKMWNDPAMDGFRNNQKIATLFKQLLTQSEGDTNGDDERTHLQWQELQLLQGELIIGFNFATQRDGDVSMVAAMSEADYKKSLAIDERLFRIDENEPRLQRTTFQGVELVCMRDRKTGEALHWQAWVQGTLLLFSKRDELERCLVRLRKQKPFLEPSEATVEILCPANFFAFLQESFDKSLRKNENSQGIRAASIARATGYSELGSVKLLIQLEKERLDISMSAEHNGPKAGFWKLLSSSPAPRGKLLNHVPEDVYSYAVSQLDIKALWRELPVMVQHINPQWAAQFQGALTMLPMMLQIDPSRDIFDNLDSLIVSYSRMQGAQSQDLFALKLRNEDQMIQTLSKVFSPAAPLRAQMGHMLAHEDVNGVAVYSMNIPDQRTGESSTYAISVAGSYLLIGNPGFVRSMISNGTKASGFYKSRAFTSMLSETPSVATAYGYSDIARMVEPLIQELHASGMLKRRAVRSKGGLTPLERFLDGLDLSKLPKARFFATFLGQGFTHTTFKKGHLQSRTSLNYRARK